MLRKHLPSLRNRDRHLAIDGRDKLRTWRKQHSERAAFGVSKQRFVRSRVSNPPRSGMPAEAWTIDETGHAEVVQVEYDPAEVSYNDLLRVFWENHDPTTLNRQGPDVGTQYRSVIFYHSPEQEAAAKASKEALAKSGRYKRPIVTEIVPAPAFWRAEEYHQQYLEKRGLSHCHI